LGKPERGYPSRFAREVLPLVVAVLKVVPGSVGVAAMAVVVAALAVEAVEALEMVLGKDHFRLPSSH